MPYKNDPRRTVTLNLSAAEYAALSEERVAFNLGMHVEKVTWYAANEVNIFRVALDAG
jgi:hypothetical protein